MLFTSNQDFRENTKKRDVKKEEKTATKENGHRKVSEKKQDSSKSMIDESENKKLKNNSYDPRVDLKTENKSGKVKK